MEIKSTKLLFNFKRKLLIIMMRSFIFLFCTAIFGFSTPNVMSQNTKVKIETDQVVSVDEVFDLIMDQTSYTFIYQINMFKDFPKVELKKGVIGANQLLEISLLHEKFDFNFSSRNTIIIKEKKPEVIVEQGTIITGTVTDNSNIPLPGVNVIIAGTSKGSQTDFDGKYSITVNKGDVLEFSYVGMKTQNITVGDNTKINVKLIEDAAQLEEVVVTALGIKKEKKRIGFATQEVKGDALQTVQTPNVVESLAGKVAGLTIISNSSDFFSDPKMYLRGETPLVVVDGVPQPSNDFWNISSDDIESINVLKGAAASALYGSLGKNGAIQITMKTGKGIDGTRISVNSSTTFQTGFLRIPQAQTQYGPGNTGKYKYGGGIAGGDGLTQGGGVNDVDYSVWGPKFDGRLLEQWDSPIDPVTGFRIPTPWVSRGPDNLGNFIETGMVTSNNVTLQSGSEKGNFVISNTYKHSKGSVPGQKLDINTLRLSGSLNISDKISLDASLQYNYQYSDNRVRGQYGPTSPIYLLSIWGGANFDVRNLQHVWVPGKEGIKQDFVESWRYNNPYALAYNWKKPWTKNDILTFAKVNFDISDNIKAFIRTTLSTNNLTDNEEISKDIYNYDINDRGGRFRYNASRYFENNTDLLITYNNNFFDGDFGIDASFGANQRYLRSENESASTTQLIIPEVFTLDNSVDQVTPISRKYEKGVYSAYVVADFSYKNFLYFGATGRIDKSSTLPVVNDTFFYPSVYSSLILSELFELPEAISFLKLRGSYAQVGGDLGIYEATNSYDTGRYRNTPTAYFPGTLENPLLEPAFTNSYEVGLEAKFFKSRLAIDMSYYVNKNGPQIYTQSFSEASGYDGILLNGRTTERTGMDFSITGVPIQTENFKWSAILNFDYNKNLLTSLPALPDGSASEWELTSNQYYKTKVGTELGDYWYWDWEKSPDGELIIYPNGLPKRTEDLENAGNTQPNFIASIANTLTYKNVSLNFMIAGRFGGITYDGYERDLWRAGGHPDAIHPERELSNIAYANGTDARTMLVEGVNVLSGDVTYDPDGNILEDTRTFGPNSTLTDYQAWAGYKGAWESVLKEKTFIKLREVALTYNFTPKLLDRTFLNTASISLIGRNLIYWTKDHFYGDLDTYTLSQGDAGLQLPSQRTYGFNLNVSF